MKEKMGKRSAANTETSANCSAAYLLFAGDIRHFDVNTNINGHIIWTEHSNNSNYFIRNAYDFFFWNVQRNMSAMSWSCSFHRCFVLNLHRYGGCWWVSDSTQFFFLHRKIVIRWFNIFCLPWTQKLRRNTWVGFCIDYFYRYNNF